MFGIRYIKVPPTTYLIKYSKGIARKKGAGLSFFYYAPTTTLVSIPVNTLDVPFIFQEVSQDYQELNIQGQVTYQISEPEKISKLLDYSLNKHGVGYITEDPQKLPQRIINGVKVLTRKELKNLPLKDAIQASESLSDIILAGLKDSEELKSLGLTILGVSILSIKPNPETARALESKTKEELLRSADEAIYERRNAAVEQERSIKENELNTEIAVEEKQRQIRETQMDAERSVQEKRHGIEKADMQSQITLEDQKKSLVSLSTANAKEEADSKAYAISALMEAISKADPQTLQVIAGQNLSPDQLISRAFQEMAENAQKVGELNISSELLSDLIGKKKDS